jgi:hypothetical protein
LKRALERLFLCALEKRGLECLFPCAKGEFAMRDESTGEAMLDTYVDVKLSGIGYCRP